MRELMADGEAVQFGLPGLVSSEMATLGKVQWPMSDKLPW